VIAKLAATDAATRLNRNFLAIFISIELWSGSAGVTPLLSWAHIAGRPVGTLFQV